MSTSDPGDDKNLAQKGREEFYKGFNKGYDAEFMQRFIAAIRTQDGTAADERTSKDLFRLIEEAWVTAKITSPGAKASEERPSLPVGLALITRFFLLLGYFIGRFAPLGLSARSLTSLAVLLAGHRRSDMADEWRAHLAGWPGTVLSRRDQGRAARGFIWAAVRYRYEDAADLAWRPADAVLSSRLMSNLFVAVPVLVVVVIIVHHDGSFGLVADIQDYGTLGVILWGMIKAGRRWRQIKLPEPKPRQTRR